MTSSSDLKFQIAILADNTPAPGELPQLPGIEWLSCRRAGPHHLEFLHGAALVAGLDFERARFDLPTLLSLFVIGDAHGCQALRDLWGSCFPAIGLDIRSVSDGSAAALTGAAVACLTGELAGQLSRSGRAVLDLAVYRREFERLQRSFSGLEQYVAELSLHKPRVLFDYPCSSSTQTYAIPGAAMEQAGGARRIRVEQRLPVDSLGVSGIALDVRAVLDSDAPIWVELRAIETDQRIGFWSVAGRLAKGSLHLSLAYAIDRAGLSLLLSVGLPPGRGAFPLGLGAPHPYEQFRARVADDITLQAPLAMRIYGGVPGVRVVAPTTAVLPVGAIHPNVTFVTPELYKSVRQVYPSAEPGESNLVQYDAILGNITVHPRERGALTVGRLDLAVPANAWRVSAHICLEHEAANPTEFALLTASESAAGAAALFANLDEESSRFSGWMRLSALESRRISAFFPKEESRLALYLLTRQAPGASADFAWARFAQLQFNAPPPNAPLQPPRTDAVDEADPEVQRGANGARLESLHTVAIPPDVQPS